MDYLDSILSGFLHYVSFSCVKPLAESDTASFIISIDVDVGNAELGEKNRGKNDRNIHSLLTESAVGRIEEQVIPLLLQTFEELELPVTFALRGQSTEVDNPILKQILESNIKHEIAAHGYSHKVFTALSAIDAENELSMISAGMKNFGFEPKSFVFPKNKISHLPLLEKYGYLSFRGYGDFLRDGMYVKKCGNLFDVHPSIYLQFCELSFSKRIIDLAVKQKRPFHAWFHPWNLGHSRRVAADRISKLLVPLVKYAKEKKRRGLLQFETMHSMAEEYRVKELSVKSAQNN